MSFSQQIETVKTRLAAEGVSAEERRNLQQLLKRLERDRYRQQSEQEAAKSRADQDELWAQAKAEGERIREQIRKTGAVELFHELWGVYHAGKPRGRVMSIRWPECLRELITPMTNEDRDKAYQAGWKRLGIK